MLPTDWWIEIFKVVVTRWPKIDLLPTALYLHLQSDQRYHPKPENRRRFASSQFRDTVNSIEHSNEQSMNLNQTEQTMDTARDYIRSCIKEFQTAATQAKQNGPPSECEVPLPPPFVTKLGYINYLEKSAQPAERTEGGIIRFANTMRSYLQHNKAPNSISTLRATSLREVARRVNHIHEDRILFLKTTYDAFRIVGMNVLVEDDAGDCIMLSLYNYLAYHENPSDFFPVGTYLAILAPYMKYAKDDPKLTLMLRCDNPECVRVFPFHRSWKAAKRGKLMLSDIDDDPEILREEGNHHFAQELYETAARTYSRALACSRISASCRIACLCNRAEVNLRLQRWEAAESDARNVLVLDPNHIKAMFRLTCALLHLNRVSEASEIASKLQERAEMKKSKSFQRLSQDIYQAIEEQQNGNYNLLQMENEISRHGLVAFHANYSSSMMQRGVVTKASGFTYRGCVALENIPKNTLLSASKAFVYYLPEGKPLLFEVSPYNRVAADSSRIVLENDTIVLLHRRPELKEIFYTLSSELPEERFKEENCRKRIDMKRIQGIISNNSFKAQPTVHDLYLTCNQPTAPRIEAGSGVWINESLFNHSCTPNCDWSNIGDHIFIHTTRDVKSGEELCLSYLNHEASLEERGETFSNWLGSGVGFSCQCDWCITVRDSPDLQEANEIIHSAYKSAIKLVSSKVKMSAAAELVLPAHDRAKYLKFFSQFPLMIQHIAGAFLWIMEGSVLMGIKNKPKEALEAYEKAAAITQAVCGDRSFNRSKDLWRIVGACMACGYETRAKTMLASIWNDFFVKAKMKKLEDKFIILTRHYVMPWWTENFDQSRAATLNRIALDVATSTKLKSSKTKTAQRKKR